MSAMRMTVWFAAAVLLATSALAADPPQKDAPAGTTRKSAATPREKADRKKAAKGGAAGSPADSKKPSAKAASAPEQVAAYRAKSVYMYAVESCEQPARCDAALRDDAEKRFMEACGACAPQERCEAENAAIKDGSAKRSLNPCAP